MIGRRGELEKNEPYIQSESQIGVIYCYFYRSETFLCCSLRITLFFYVRGRAYTSDGDRLTQRKQAINQ